MKRYLLIPFLIMSSLSRAGGDPTGPSFNCSAVTADSIAAMICDDASLSSLDRQLALVYKAALEKAHNEHPPLLKAEQRGWIKGRDECWKSDDVKACVSASYRTRIATLQAQYRLVDITATVFYSCNGNPAHEIVATFFPTSPPTLIAERGDQVSLMFLQPSASGAKYQGRNESLWEHQGEAMISWGYNSETLRCKKTATQ
jgi:uncharacterized protein